MPKHDPPGDDAALHELERELMELDRAIKAADENQEAIELVAGPYLELFARETKEGWDCLGDQVALFDHGAVTTRRQPSRLVDAPTLFL
jgi:N6-adenosine-specific RNA methylase IME4